MSKYNFPDMLITDRYILEAVTPFHAEEAYEVIDSCREYIGEFLEWCTPEYSLEDTENFYATQQEAFEEEDSFDYIIIDKQTDKIVGSIGVVMKYACNANLGYWIDEKEQGNGIIFECIDTLKDFAFNESCIERLNIQTDLKNKASQKVAERSGFAFEGIVYSLRKDTINNKMLDMTQYTYIKDTEKMSAAVKRQDVLKEVYNFK